MAESDMAERLSMIDTFGSSRERCVIERVV